MFFDQTEESPDSEDLTDEEIERAFPASSIETMIEFLRERKCESGHKFLPASHALRKRGDHYYHRVDLVCAENTHTGRVTFRADWLQLKV